ncbi:MAG: cysteine hydrolase family protein [Bacteroidota bacterium]
MLKLKKPALLLIDIQKGMAGKENEAYWGGNRNNPDAERKSQTILVRWRKWALPIFHIRHSSQNPHSKLHASHEGFAFNELTAPIVGEPIITKNVNSAFIGTDLKERLDALGIDTLVIVGLTTNHCVSTTTRMAGNFGYDTYLISDATATFDRKGIHGEMYTAETVHLTTLASLRDEFATILSTEQLLKEM